MTKERHGRGIKDSERYIYDKDARTLLKLWKDMATVRWSIRGTSLKLYTQRTKRSLRNNKFDMRWLRIRTAYQKKICKSPNFKEQIPGRQKH